MESELFGIKKGIICQQVNCRAAMGAGLAKAIMDKYPVVYEKYMHLFDTKSAEEVFGKVQMVELGSDLYVANVFSQLNYGNPAKTGKIYTDADALVAAVSKICDRYPDLTVYLPHTVTKNGEDNGIGCGYGGETWSKLEDMFKGLNKPNLALLDTVSGIVHTFGEKPGNGLKMASNDVVQLNVPLIKSDYEGRAVIFDTETTGLRNDDELLSIAVVNEEGEVLLDTYVKPDNKKYWPEAEKVNHISPGDVKNAPSAAALYGVLSEIFGKAGVIIGHNVAFDLRFVKNCVGIDVDKDKVFDTCKPFKEEEPKGKHNLEAAIEYYCPERKEMYEMGAHTALTDTIATMHVYNSMMDKERDR